MHYHIIKPTQDYPSSVKTLTDDKVFSSAAAGFYATRKADRVNG
jgi:hypothetical protein